MVVLEDHHPRSHCVIFHTKVDIFCKSMSVFPFNYRKSCAIFPILILYLLFELFVVRESFLVHNSTFKVVLYCQFCAIANNENMDTFECGLEKDGIDCFVDDNCIRVGFYGGSRDYDRELFRMHYIVQHYLII